MEEMLIGVTDRTIPIFIPDPASTTGAGKTGLNAAAITVTYTRYETDNDVVTTDVTSSVNDLSALTDAHNDWGWKEVNSTLSKGQYRLDLADALFAAGAWYVVVQVTITSGTAAATAKAFRLVSVNALDGVRHGLTALPNAAAEAVGGLYTRGGDLDTQLDDLAAALVLIDNFVDDLEGRLTAALATTLQAYHLAIGRVVVGAGSTTTAIKLSTVNGGAPSADNDFYNGRVLIFTSGGLTLQAVAITDYDGATTTATVTAATAAPANTDTAVLV